MSKKSDGQESVRIRLDGQFEGRKPGEPTRARSQVVAAIMAAVRQEYAGEKLELEISSSSGALWDITAVSTPDDDIIRIESQSGVENLGTNDRGRN